MSEALPDDERVLLERKPDNILHALLGCFRVDLFRNICTQNY